MRQVKLKNIVGIVILSASELNRRQVIDRLKAEMFMSWRKINL